MIFDINTGAIELTRGLHIRRGMTRAELLAMNTKWEEDWSVINGIPCAMRTLFNLNKGIDPKTILVVYVTMDERPIAFWDLSPWDLTDCIQNRPQGKCTKRMRAWFKEACGVALPVGGKWGHIDASYDHWNQTAGIVCNYREAFANEEAWLEYRRNNKF